MATGTIKTPGWKLLWTNPNPSSDFAAQKVSLDLSGYTEVKIIMSNDGNDTTHVDFCNVGFASRSAYFTAYNNAVYPKNRSYTVSSSGIEFQDNKEYNTTKNAQNKPLYIYAQ